MADQNKADSSQTSIQTFQNVNDICRFCLSDTKSSITIHDKCFTEESGESEEDSIYNFVTKLKFIKMVDDEKYPTQVCEDCYNVVKICKEFGKLCEKSDNILRNRLESFKRGSDYLNQDDEDEIKIVIQVPNAKDNPNDNIEVLMNETYDKSGVDILDGHKQMFNLPGKIKPLSNPAKDNKSLIIEDDKNTCGQCSLKFSSTRALNFHNVVAHNGECCFTYKCKHCQKSFTDQTKLKRHCYMVHNIIKLPDEDLNNITKADKFICFYCESRKEFPSQNELLSHLALHKSDIFQSYSCLYCKNIFPTSLSLKEHLSLMHEREVQDSEQLLCVKPASQTDLSAAVNIFNSVMDLLPASQQKGFKLICKNCNPPLEFSTTGDFVSHVNTHKNEMVADRNWSCTKCPVSYTTKQSLHCHMKEKHNLDKMTCPEPGCSECFTTNRQLIHHGIVVHQKYFAYFHKVFKKALQPTEGDNRVKNYECDICQKKYIYKTSLRKHIFGSHLGKSVKDPVVCSYCGKTLASKLNLKSHIEFMHEALFVSCPICKKKINFRTIGKHYKTHKTNSEFVNSQNSFLCNLCGKILKSKRSFEDHQKLHKNIRDEVCDICGSGFTTKKFLRLHKKTHEGIRRKIFSCDQCEKVFSGRQTLNRHLLTHSGKKNFICEICSKCFYTLQELNRHVRYHKKEYRFDCQLCDMRFLDKSRFRHHMMRHRNVRPHKCEFCEKMFIVRGKMNLHMATKHNVEVESRKGVWKDPKTYVPLDDLL